MKEEKEKSNKQHHGKEEDQMKLSSIVTEGSKEENEGNKEQSQGQEGQTSSAPSSAPFNLQYDSLPYYLQSCLMYCCIFPENYWINKGKLI